MTPPEQPELLADVVSKLYENPDERAALVRASANAAKQYSREHQASRMLEVLEKVAAGEHLGVKLQRLQI